MNRVRIVALIAATLGVAVGAGTLFQQGATQHEAQAPLAPGGSGAGQGETSLVELVPNAAQYATASVLPGVVQTADPLAEQAAEAAAMVVDRPRSEPDSLQDQEGVTAVTADTSAASEVVTIASDPALIEDIIAEIDACSVWLVVTPEAGAMLDMSLFAPCDGDAAVRVSHAGLNFDTRIAADGQLMLAVPALQVDAELTVTFADGRTVVDAVEVADAAVYDRVAIQWEGPAVLDMNAYEFGADFGSANHIHPGNPATPRDVARGFLTILGDPELDMPRLAQVYSFPTGLSARMGQVALELEVAVTEASCAQPLRIETLEVLSGSAPQIYEIRLDMPECDGLGGYLVLKNLLPELTIALN